MEWEIADARIPSEENTVAAAGGIPAGLIRKLED